MLFNLKGAVDPFDRATEPFLKIDGRQEDYQQEKKGV